MGDREEFLALWHQHITRPGSEKLLEWLDKKTDFFTAPASTRFHGACEGGLCMHSLNVYHALHDTFFTEGDSEETFAICALLHDLVITLGVYAWFQIAISPNVVAALLTIMGYSLYDTVVEFNRMDENARQLKDGVHRTYYQICNFSINEVFVRSINTTIVTVVPVVALLAIGGTTLRDFAFAMLVGELLGTYSSFAVASPLLAMWKTREPKWAKLEARYGESAAKAVSGEKSGE